MHRVQGALVVNIAGRAMSAARVPGNLAYTRLMTNFIIRAQGDCNIDRIYWTGSGWSRTLRFAKRYTPSDAHEIIRKRFTKMAKIPIVRCYGVEKVQQRGSAADQ